MTEEYIRNKFPTPEKLRSEICLLEHLDREGQLTDIQRAYYNELCSYRLKVYPKTSDLSAWYTSDEIYILFN